MIKRFILALFLIIPSTLLFAGYPYDSVCEIRVDRGGGSATLIAVSDDKALLLTCQHVAERVGDKVKVNWAATGEEGAGAVVAIGEKGLDIALCVVPRPLGLLPVPVTMPSRTKSGPITNIGFPGMTGVLGWQRGEIISISSDELRYDCRPIPGMSGGATLDQYGNVIGVITRYGRSWGLSTSGTDMMYFLRNYAQTHAEAGWVMDAPETTLQLSAAAPAEQVVVPEDWDEFEMYIFWEYLLPPEMFIHIEPGEADEH